MRNKVKETICYMENELEEYGKRFIEKANSIEEEILKAASVSTTMS